MFTFKYYFKIKKNSRAYLPEENKKAVLTTAIYFKVSTPVRSQKNAGFGEKKSIEHVRGNWNLKSEKVQGREVLAMEIMCVP